MTDEPEHWTLPEVPDLELKVCPSQGGYSWIVRPAGPGKDRAANMRGGWRKTRGGAKASAEAAATGWNEWLGAFA